MFPYNAPEKYLLIAQKDVETVKLFNVYDASHPSFPVGGVDGITLSADSKRLRWTPLSGRRLYSIATDLLAEASRE